MKESVLATIEKNGILPAVRVRDQDESMRALAQLLRADISVAEVAMSMEGGLSILAAATAAFGSRMLLGAGTVLDAETARLCILEGAAFLVSPCLSLPVIEMGHRYSVPVFCGALTPTEIVAAWSAGAACVKVFPADAMGGPSYIRSVRAPLPQVALLPMGGVTLSTVGDYFAAGSFALGVGGDLVSSSRLREPANELVLTRGQEYRAAVARARSM